MAEIIIKCENCGIELAAPEELLGQEVRCYGCETLQVIKAPAPAEPDVPILQAPEPVEPPPPPAAVEAPTFAPMMEITPDAELEMPQTASSDNQAEQTAKEIPTLNLQTQISHEPEPSPEPIPKPPAPESATSLEEEITFQCVGCQSILVAPSEHIGYNVRCDQCDTKMPVPEASNATMPEETPEPEPVVPEPVPPEIIPLPTPPIPQAPIAEDDDATTNIKIPLPTSQPSPNNESALPKAPIILDDDDDDKSIIKLRPPSRR